jgi:monoamine oxidase
MTDHSSSPIAIIGAGLAGLTAAYRLKQSGFPVNVYEARERLGGRVLTVSLGDSYTELGGQALEDGGEAKAIRSLIDEMGLSIDTGSLQRIYSSAVVFGDQINDFSDIVLNAPTAEQGLKEQLAALGERAQNLDELLGLLCTGKDPKLRIFLTRIMRSYEGSDPVNLSTVYQSSLLMLLQRYQEWTIKKSRGEVVTFSISHVKGGNSRLIDALGEKLKGHIHKDAPLKKISRGSNGSILLHFGNGQKVITDRVVLALPCSTLRNVAIEDGIFP